MDEQRIEKIARKLMDGPVRDYTGFKGPCGCSDRYCGYCRILDGAREAIREALASQEEERINARWLAQEESLRSLREGAQVARLKEQDEHNG